MSTIKRIGIEEARLNLAEILLRARYKNERFMIAKHGVPLALVIPIDCIPTIHEPAALSAPTKPKEFLALAKLPAA